MAFLSPKRCPLIAKKRFAASPGIDIISNSNFERAIALELVVLEKIVKGSILLW
jgi:hypothetical protein